MWKHHIWPPNLCSAEPNLDNHGTLRLSKFNSVEQLAVRVWQLDAFLSALGVLDDDTDVDEDIGIQTNPKLTLPESFPSLSLIFALTPYTSGPYTVPDSVPEPPLSLDKLEGTSTQTAAQQK